MELESVNLYSLEDISSPDKATLDQNGEKRHKVLHLVKYSIPPKEEAIAKITSSLWYIFATANVLDVVDDLTKEESIEAVGVVDSSNKLLGIIIREQLFQIIGRPFGRDLLGRQTLENTMSQSKRFDWNENIFTVAENVEQKDRTIQYYLLQNEHQEFRGIFSSWDIMMFLSNLTRKDIAFARTIQSRLIHDFYNYKEDSFEITYSTQMAKGIGGDFIGFKVIGSKQYLLSLCDVAGKGIAAALISSTIAGMLESFDFSTGIKGFLILLNRFIIKTFGSELFITGVFLEFQAESSTLTVYDLGHSHLGFLRKGKLASLKSPITNPPLGIEESYHLKRFRFSLAPGDTLLVYSDGLIEQEGSEGYSYSLSRIQSILDETSSSSLSSALVRIWEDFHSFRGHVPQFDDVTILLLQKR